MTIEELEQVTRDCIMNIYKKAYTGKISIEKLDPYGYCIKLGMDTPDQPLVIYAELKDKEFLKFLKAELQSRRFNFVYFGKLSLTYPQLSCNEAG